MCVCVCVFFYLFIYAFRECLLENSIKINTYIGHTTTTLSRRITYHLSDKSTIKQHQITKYNNDAEKLTSSVIQKTQ